MSYGAETGIIILVNIRFYKPGIKTTSHGAYGCIVIRTYLSVSYDDWGQTVAPIHMPEPLKATSKPP
jgi:hypothetical protein